MADGAENAGDPATISIKFTSSDKAAGQVLIPLQKTVGDLKQCIRSQFIVEPKRLIFQGRILNKDDQTLTESKIKDGLTVVVQIAQGGGSASASAYPTLHPPTTGATEPMPSTTPAVTPTTLPVRPPPAMASTPIEQAIATVRGQPADIARDCLKTLLKVIDNIVQHPQESKYRKIKRSNQGFHRKVGNVPGGDACMRALGFAEINAGESWLLTPNAAAWEVLTAGRVRIQACMATLPAASGGTPFPNVGATGFGPSAGFAAGLGELPPSGMAPALDTATIQRMTRDPSAMRNMLNNPMMQAMARDNPQMGAAMQMATADPSLFNRTLEMIHNNPAMVQQTQQMLQQDPSLLGRMSHLNVGGVPPAGMNAAQGFPQPTPGFGGLGRASPSPVPAPTLTPAPSPAPGVEPPAAPSGGGGDNSEEMSEDELIAEALRRSLEDD